MYGYNGDKMVSITTTFSDIPGVSSSQNFTYDALGNPTTYNGMPITWQGRKLMSVGDTTMQYDYNGLRTRKGERYYYWHGNILKMEYWIEGAEEKYIYYYYDESGISGISYCGTEFYFQKNIFGDVVAIYDVNGNLQCTYEYDAWGNHKIYNQNGAEINKSTIHIGNINPIRYRGYYWDSEFGLYYLQSRYYSPEIGRFISPDSVEYLAPDTIGGLNLYAYCMNNPIMFYDPSGHAVISLLAGLIIGGLVSWGLSELFGEHLVTGTGLAIAGGSAVVSGIMAMTLATPVGWIVGGITAVAGIFTLAFASAELQKHFTGDNWMLDGGMSEGVYYTLMTISSITASVGTAASSVAYHYKINAVTQKGRINGKMVSGTDIDGYHGLRFSSKTGKVYSLEFHSNHNGHGVHIQWNQWFTTYPKFPGEYVLNPLWRLRLW